jgi:hypothetical protein
MHRPRRFTPTWKLRKEQRKKKINAASLREIRLHGLAGGKRG